jgi:hypothetical protein
VDVRYIGRVEKLQALAVRERHRPLLAGTSVGHRDITAGTLGCFVRAAGEIGLLSNNHVLADENRAAIGDAILQPAPSDGGEAADDAVARLAEFVPLEVAGANRLDCAFATLVEGVDVDPTGFGRSFDPEPLAPELADRVEKLGRTTALTEGRVTAFNVNGLAVGYEISDSVRFDGQIEIVEANDGNFSLGGDSGSLITSAGERRPVGLLFAGSDQGGPHGGPVTYVNPIAEVLDALNVEFYGHS